MTDLTDQATAALAKRRLARLREIDRQFGQRLNAAGVKLLRHATFEAYVALRDLERLHELESAS